jgi:GGDEF domain-containing protein
MAFAERIRAEVSKPFVVDEHQVFTCASIGVSINDFEYCEPEDMLRDADIAMYHAKETSLDALFLIVSYESKQLILSSLKAICGMQWKGRNSGFFYSQLCH